MTTPLRRGTTALTGLALAASALTLAGSPTQAAPAPGATLTDITAATLTWGISGYAQDGIFGPWVIKDLTGDAALLEGSVSGGDQTAYVVEPIPATSMSPSDPQDTPNVVQFSAGNGTADHETGEATLTWDGSYTVNAYPTSFGAPNEVYSDPALSLDADGSGDLSFDVTLGEGQDMLGQPTPAVDLGRLTVMTFSAGSDARVSSDAFRYTADYQGVEIEVASGTEQTRSCSSADGATGWWGAWPGEFVNAMPEAVRPHFYSTGCAGKQDNKPPLPVDIDLGVGAAVSVARTDFASSGAHEVAVTGSGFDPAEATGTRPPLSGKAAGTYVVFGKFAANWRPSQGAPSSARKNTSQRWAVLAEDMATIGGAPAAVELTPEGTFSTTLTIDKAALDAVATDPSLVNYGIYTYPGSGAVSPGYETYTPVTFSKATPTVTVVAPKRTYGQSAQVGVSVTSAAEEATGSVVLTRDGDPIGTAELSDGVAVFALGKLSAGRYPVTASYSGDDLTSAGTEAVTLTVARAATTTKLRLKRSPTSDRAGKAVVKVSPRQSVDGKVRIQVRKAAGKKVVRDTVKVRKGKSVTQLRRLPAGRYQLKATYLGNDNHKKSAKKITFRVR